MSMPKHWIVDMDTRETGGKLETVFASTDFPTAKAAFEATPSPGFPHTLWLARVEAFVDGSENCTTMACK